MANLWLVLLAALVAAAQCSPSAPFAQYNATIYLYGNQTTSVSSWSSLPFNETIKQIVWWEPLQFIILFESSNPWIATVQSNGGLLLTSWTLDVWAFGGVAAVQGNYFAYAAVWGQEVYTSWCDGAAQCSHYQFPLPISSVTQVLDLGILAPGSLVLGTDDGLVLLNVTNTSSAWEWVTLTNTTGASIRTSYISKVHVRNDKTILATSREFYSSSNAWTTDLVHEVKGLKETYYYRTPGIIDARPTAFVGDTVRGGVHFGNEVCDNLLFDNGTFLRISGAYEGGLPQRNITCGAQSAADNIWFGTKFGVSVLFPDDTWKYFFGPRWLPGEGFTTGMNVKSLAAGLNPTDASEVVLVATDTGLSVFYVVQWPSMDLKAQHYQNQLPRFIRYGLVSQLSLDGFGNSNQFTQTATANDGLWSSLYLGSQSFRYAASGDPLAKQDAWDAFHGMQMLVNVTGDLNYPARNFIQHATPCPSSYNPSSTMPGFCWNGDTSSDEIVGHLHGYPIFYYLVASTPTEKAAVAATISNILGGIVRNNFSLIDPTTLRPTTWGKWSPAYLNNDPFWYDERGVNGNQILSYLVTGYAITEESIFADAFWELVNDAHYDINIIDLKITQPTDINFSDDELTFLPYLSFLFGKSFANGTANPLYEHLAPYVWKSIARTHSIVANEKPSLWNAIYAAAAIQLGGIHANYTQLAGTLKDSIWWMQTYPLSQVDWPVNNAVRIDAVFPHVDMGRSGPGDGTSHTLTLFPYDEQSMLRWNSNPFRTQQGGGHSEFDPSPFLYPFWVGRYYQLW